MKLKVKPPKHKDEYQVKIDFYHGDMDASDERSFYFKTELETILLIKELQKLNKPNKRGHVNYRPENRIEIEEYYWKVQTSSDLINKLFAEWPDEDWPWHNDYECYAALESWEIYYYDEEGRRVEMELSK